MIGFSKTGTNEQASIQDGCWPWRLVGLYVLCFGIFLPIDTITPRLSLILLGAMGMKIQGTLEDMLFLAGSLFFMVFGGTLFFAPRKFKKFTLWWARQIGFPQTSANDEGRGEGIPFGQRFPGLVALCFGTFMFIMVFHSLMKHLALPRALPPTSTGKVGASPAWLKIIGDLAPVAMGAYLLFRTEAIIGRAGRYFRLQDGAKYSFRFARIVFSAVGVLMVLGGLAGLFLFFRS
jgi:hypothetical protein